MSIDEIAKTCFEHDLDIEQVFLLYLLAEKNYDKDSLMFRYVLHFGKFPQDKIDSLIKEGFLDDFNSPGKSLPEMYVLTKKSASIFATVDMGEELWNSYPATFPISDRGTNFIARAGADKNHVISEYLKRIGRSVKKHKFVMEQLEKYTSLIERRLINGYKISDFVKQELWDTISTLDKEPDVDFGRDI
jgi:hypothetical protein